MSLFIAMILGLVQGLTEFFPISSSAHVKLMEQMLGVKGVPVIFDLSCHLGTLFALLWFFKEEVLRLFRKDRNKLVYLFIALLPLFPSYYFLAPIREIVSKPEFLGLFMMGTGGILLTGQKVRVKKKRGLLYDALLIGAMQSTALFPGISRSASTISTAQVLGWSAKDAVRFSFLLSIPTILGGNYVELEKLIKKGELMQFATLPCFIGFLTALLVGLFVIRFAIRWLEKGNLMAVAWYCMIVGILTNAYMYVK